MTKKNVYNILRYNKQQSRPILTCIAIGNEILSYSKLLIQYHLSLSSPRVSRHSPVRVEISDLYSRVDVSLIQDRHLYSYVQFLLPTITTTNITATNTTNLLFR